MAVTIKSAREIEYMREAGRLLAEVHEELGAFIRPGISTLDIDMLGEKLIRSRGCVPNFLNYNGYPASICVSSMAAEISWRWFPSLAALIPSKKLCLVT